MREQHDADAAYERFQFECLGTGLTVFNYAFAKQIVLPHYTEEDLLEGRDEEIFDTRFGPGIVVVCVHCTDEEPCDEAQFTLLVDSSDVVAQRTMNQVRSMICRDDFSFLTIH